jgi:hypothetical protein
LKISKTAGYKGFYPTKKAESYKFANEAVSHLEMLKISGLQNYVPLKIAQGRRIKIRLLSTWGDRFWIGLNRIEIFDQNNLNILSDANSDTFELTVEPSSVSRAIIQLKLQLNTMESNKWDLSNPDALFNEVVDGQEDSMFWSMPYINPKIFDKNKSLGSAFNFIEVSFKDI